MRFLPFILALNAFAEDPVTAPVPPPTEAAPVAGDAPKTEAVPAATDATTPAATEAPKTDAAPVTEAPKTDAAPTTDAPKTDEVSVQDVSMLVSAIQSQNWPLAIGLGLSVMVAFANKFGLKNAVGDKAVPWVTMGLAVAGTVGMAMVAGSPVDAALAQGVLAGVAAIGGWELLLKHVLASKKEAPSAA
jgi:uncharacterized membrane protein